MAAIGRRTFGGLVASLPGVLAYGAEPSRPIPTDVWIGGDVHLGDHDVDVLAPLRPFVEGAIGIVNLEGPVATTPGKLVNHPASLAVLRAAGVRVAGIANNHARDLGPEAPRHTADAVSLAYLRAAGDPVGPAVVREPGRARVVITAHDLEHGVPEGLGRALAAARGLGDALVATFHVTGTPSHAPPPELRRAVEIAIAAGACVVASHGSHRTAKIERRGATLIGWGLGNLAFACDCTSERDALLLRVQVDRAGVVDARALPIDAGVHGGVATPAHDPAYAFELLRAMGSSPFTVEGPWARF